MTIRATTSFGKREQPDPFGLHAGPSELLPAERRLNYAIAQVRAALSDFRDAKAELSRLKGGAPE